MPVAFNLYNIASLLICAMCLAILIFNVSRWNSSPKYLNLLTLYVVSSLTTETFHFLVSYKLVLPPRIHTTIIFTFLEFYIFATIIYKSLTLKSSKSIILLISILYGVLNFIILKDSQKLHKINHSQILIDNFCMVCICIPYYIEIFKLPPKLNLLKDSRYWIINGALLYFAGSSPQYLFSKYLIFSKNINFLYSIQLINSILFIVMLLFILKSIKCRPMIFRSA